MRSSAALPAHPGSASPRHPSLLSRLLSSLSPLAAQPRQPHGLLASGARTWEGVWCLEALAQPSPAKPRAHPDWHMLVDAHLSAACPPSRAHMRVTETHPAPSHTPTGAHLLSCGPISSHTPPTHADTSGEQHVLSSTTHGHCHAHSHVCFTYTFSFDAPGLTPSPLASCPTRDLPPEGVNHQAVRLVQPLDHCVLEGAVQPGDIDLLLVGIVAGPEEVSGNPIHREAMSVGQV